MFDRKNDVARNKKRADAIVYAGAADEVVLTQSDFESEEEFRRWKAWSDADYKQTEKAMRRDYDHEWMDEAFRRAWMNYANKSLLDMGLITEQEYQKMAVKITNSPDRLRQESRP